MPDSTYLILGLIGALFALAAFGVIMFFARQRPPSKSEPIAPLAGAVTVEDELRRQLARRDSELEELRSQLSESHKTQATAEARHAASERLLDEHRALHEKSLLE